MERGRVRAVQVQRAARSPLLCRCSTGSDRDNRRRHPHHAIRAVTAFARSPNAGLIVVVSAASLTHRKLIITLAARHRLPTVYAYRVLVTHGVLITRRK
jgi:hypothetical protein